MTVLKKVAAASIVAVTLAAGSQAEAQSAGLVPFDQFVMQVSAATLPVMAAKAGTQVADPAAFAAMRSHVTSLYSGVTVKHSFLLDNHAYDCVPIAQQPSVRLQGLTTIASPPPAIPSAAGPVGLTSRQLADGQTADALGNSLVCEDGTIPMRRVTLEDVGRFKTLQEFFQKGPDGAGQLSANPADSAVHKYAHSYQTVKNIGGSSTHNIWNQTINKSKGQIFSLDQFWYSNNKGPIQTLEMGLQNYPGKYGTTNTVLFIYWTSDGYNKVGCYNLDCAGFVQTSNKVYLGKGFTSYSTLGGSQYSHQMVAFLYNGNWWLYLNGGDGAHAFGYYPGSAYHKTAMASGASGIDYGGEVTGGTSWPPMGSGKFANQGFGQSAYIRNMFYFPNSSTATNADLTASQTSPKCYTNITTASGGSWGTYLYYGGPGGSKCE